ncbi:hypothetical protein [Cellulophaga sp. L1A9]|uniref:hypothetical protein n=1 Tax=Cellulophaga sp. L1A9 TaxID=2686362 RepID=UPI00131E384B|nr:hypothetical protein [Cellulophaga sp. L1A9]
MRKFLALPLLVLFIGFTSCSDSEDNDEPVVEENNEILSYAGIELKLDDSDTEDYGIAFSTATGETYAYAEISADNIADIDIVSATNQAFIAFNSPDADDVLSEIEGAKSTKIQVSNVAMTVAEFDAMEDDTLLKDLTVSDDNEAQSITYREVVLFETAEGKIGAFKINMLNAQRISIDVKVMK